jgi:RHS repeat-associated protein
MLSDGLRRYEYDAANRLANVTTGIGVDAPTTRYVHNALGQRLFKTEPQFAPVASGSNPTDPGVIQTLLNFFGSLWGSSTGTATGTISPNAADKLGFQYFYDEDGSLLYEAGTSGANSTGSAHYVYLPTPNGPMPVAFYNGSRHYAVQTDHLNTPRRLTQSDKKVAWQWAFSAFGDEQPTTARNRFVDTTNSPSLGTTTVADVTFNLRYPGQYFDKESGLSYNYFRSYSADTGRYTQADPIDLQGGWNKYSYVSGNPLMYSDPKGLLGIPFPAPTAPAFTSACLANPALCGPVLAGAGGYAVGTLIYPLIARPLSRAIDYCMNSEPRDCSKEWREARATCVELIEEQYAQDAGRRKKRPIKGVTGGYTDLEQCARGLVSEACGGNRVER